MNTTSEPTIIISDLHLGHRASQIRGPEELVPILKEARSVIFNGLRGDSCGGWWQAASLHWIRPGTALAR